MARSEYGRMSVRTPDPMAPCRSHGTFTVIHTDFRWLTHRKPSPGFQSPLQEESNVALYQTCSNTCTDNTLESIEANLSFSELRSGLVSVVRGSPCG